ncbi:hypothetical protein XENOCAPTIV_026047 [Xenoophorus captivus]|uniref:CBM21 domain-containing protein n=1 Tax=Xenoophorus captivus TaxID=1517983 RepID=A0ABV0QM01_9TELE
MDADEENDDEEDEEDDDTEDVRLIPRCSPVPRKRGSSIFDETAEYMRIHQALSAGKRVSFADTTGGDLVDVREFVAFDSDEEDSAKWEEEEAKYRKAEREPTYTVHPEFHAPGSGVLLQAVRSNKVEVQQISPVEDEPLAFSGIIRVLNISFHKAVYIRSTMDSWATYFDHPADYVLGSNDGDTDQFSFKLSFAPPYTAHGSRIEFVVRYETSDGDYWANNSSMNYAVTLLLSYEDDPAQPSTDVTQKRSILKTPKKAVPQSGSSATPEHGPPFVDGSLFTPTVFTEEHLPSKSSETELQTESALVLHADESVQPDRFQSSLTLHRQSVNHMSEQSVHSRSTAALSLSGPSSQESEQSSDESQAKTVKTPASEAPLSRPPVAEINLLSTAGEDWMAVECVSCPCVSEGLEQEAKVGLNELNEGLLEVLIKSAAHHADRTPVAETHKPVEVENEGQLSREVSRDVAPQSVSAWSEKEDPTCISLRKPLENAPFNMLSDVSEIMFEGDVSLNLRPCVFFLTGVLSLSLVMQAPSALFFIGLLLVLHCF